MNADDDKKRSGKVALPAVLMVCLVVAVCAQTFYIVRLHHKVDEALGPSSSMEITTASSPSSSSSTLRDPSIQGEDLLGLHDSFWGDPFAEMQRMHDEMNRLFGDSLLRLGAGRDPGAFPDPTGFTLVPRLDLSDEGDHFLVRMDLPGADKTNINVEVKDRTLTVSANRDEIEEEKGENGQILRRERHTGSFRRSLTLPGNVDSGSAEAKYENGVLTITIPKADMQEQDSHPVEIR